MMFKTLWKSTVCLEPCSHAALTAGGLAREHHDLQIEV